MTTQSGQLFLKCPICHFVRSGVLIFLLYDLQVFVGDTQKVQLISTPRLRESQSTMSHKQLTLTLPSHRYATHASHYVAEQPLHELVGNLVPGVVGFRH
jgi:hypothetical protein